MMKLMIKNTRGESISVPVHPYDTFRDLKTRIQNESGVNLDLDQLNFKGRKITDDQFVTTYFFNDDPSFDFPDLGNSVEGQMECVVPGCGNTLLNCPEKSFFKFPLEEERWQHWLLICRRIDLLEKTSTFPNEQHTVCSDHFLDDQFVDESKQKLAQEAVPMVFHFDSNNQMADINNDDIVTQENCEVLIKEELSNLSEKSILSSDEEADAVNPGQLCRLCATSISEVVYIFSSAGQEQRIAEKINSCLPVTVRNTDTLPKQLCMSCVTKLNLCHEFAEACIQAEDKLIGLQEQNYFVSPYVSWTKAKDSNISRHNRQLEGEGSSYCCPLCFEGNMMVHCDQLPKAEPGTDEGKKMTRVSGIFATDHEKAVNDESNDGINNHWHEENTNAENSSPGDSPDQDDGDDLYDFPREDSKLYNDTSTLSDGPCCRICGDVFENIELCLAHSVCHADSDIFPCSLCDLCFSTQSSFTSHCEKHKNDEKKLKPKPSKRIICDGCGRRFNSERTLKGHNCAVTPRPHKCSDCGKFFRTEVRLLFHQQFHQGGNPVVCEYCGKEFSRENNLFDHVRLVHMGEKAHCCDQCGKTFQLKARLVAHQRVHTGERPFVCEICGGKFYDKATLKGHRVTHLEVKPFQCEKCGRCFARKTLFKQHTLAHLSDERKRPRVYTCKICVDVTFPTYVKLLDHRKEVHPEVDMTEVDANAKVSKPFKCDDCGKSFAYRVTLVAHRRNHTGELPFQCEFCEKKFSQKRSLVLHRRIHTGEKPFACHDCGKRFVQSAHLYSHQRLHTGEKPYACEVCGESFRLKDVRDAHQRKHTGERPFKCNVCSKAFRTSHSYYQHMWIHQGKKPYPCGYCGKAFRRSNGLKIHIRIHTGEKPHACDVCGRCFAQKQDMKKHRNLHVAGKL